jgi:2-octaprenyl-6-methoxyphenol hydroxylase
MTIVIVGFGPAGETAALAFLAGGVPATEIAIIDPHPRATPTEARHDARILALNAGSRRFLDALGLWTSLGAKAYPMTTIALSDTALNELVRPEVLGFGPREDGEPLAHLVPLRAIELAAREAVEAAGIPVLAGPLTSVKEAMGVRQVVTPNGVLMARLLVIADGAQSSARVLAGISTHGWAYDQRAMTGIVHHSRDHEGQAVQHFLPSGPFALLPLDAHRSSMVWSERPEIAREILAMPAADLRDEISRRAAGWRGEITKVEALSSHPLGLSLARRFIGARLALVADAAHVVHPLAGQGLNLGFADVATLAELVADQLRVGLDPGDPGVLEAYQARRRPPAVAMASVTEGLNRLFSNDFGPLRVLREVGLGLVNRAPGIQAWLQQQAAGAFPGEPRLFRGEPL